MVKTNCRWGTAAQIGPAIEPCLRIQSWEKLSEIGLDMKLPQSGKPYVFRYCHRGLDRLRDDTLIWAPDIRDDQDRPVRHPLETSQRLRSVATGSAGARRLSIG